MRDLGDADSSPRVVIDTPKGPRLFVIEPKRSPLARLTAHDALGRFRGGSDAVSAAPVAGQGYTPRLSERPPDGDEAHKRSLLYIAAFCALAFAVESAFVAGPDAYAGREASVWALSLLALLCGVMALIIRRPALLEVHGLGPSSAMHAPSPSRERPPERLAERDLEPEPADALRGLGAWRSKRARTFSDHDLQYLPPLPDAAPLPSAMKDNGPRRQKKQAAAFDPWKKALNELDSREGGRGPR